MKKIGIFGGTFDPPHIGHIRAEKAFVESVKPDDMIIMPTYMPPFKSNASATAQQRLDMCRLAFPDACVSDYEICKGGVSYTYLTVEHFKAVYPDAVIYLLVGTDQVSQLEKWRNSAYLFENVTFAAISRFDSGNAIDAEITRHKELGAKIIHIPVEETVISSSQIRSRISEQYLTEEVYEYIRKHGLYGEI